MPTDLLDSELLKKVCMAGTRRDCGCSLGACAGWESFTEHRWPTALLRRMGTLRDASVEEPTLEEFHPHGTRYALAVAPVAVSFFPYNRCDVYECGRCGRTLLRYTEYGGYYLDHRVREVLPELIA